MKRAVTKKTERLLTRVLKYLRNEPDRLDMRTWGALHPTFQTDPETGGKETGVSTYYVYSRIFFAWQEAAYTSL